jgi:hypothetical protein
MRTWKASDRERGKKNMPLILEQDQQALESLLKSSQNDVTA